MMHPERSALQIRSQALFSKKLDANRYFFLKWLPQDVILFLR